MKAELELGSKEIEAIAESLANIVIPKIVAVISRSEDEDELLTTKEAADLLKVSAGQIYQWVHNARHGLSSFPYLKQGGQLRFSKKALMNWHTGKQ